MTNLEKYFNDFYSELRKYADGIHVLNEGITEQEISDFEEKYNISLPFYYREWLKINNGGELFATPVGTNMYGILGNKERRKGVGYLEDNFDRNKKRGIPDVIFIIARECTGNIIGFDWRHTNKMDEGIIYWNHETGECTEWDTFGEWLNEQMQDGKMLINYDGSESDYFDFL